MFGNYGTNKKKQKQIKQQQQQQLHSRLTLGRISKLLPQLCYNMGEDGALSLGFHSVCLPKIEDTSIYQQIKKSSYTKYFIELACSVRIGVH